MQNASPNIQTARIICVALMGGVVLFWGAAFAIAGGGGLGAELPLDATVLLAIVLVVALGAFGAALAFRSKAVASDSNSAVRDPQAAEASNPLTNLIIAWALLEGQALMAGIVYLLTGNAAVLLIPALVFVIGFAMCFPRPEWFDQTRHAA